MGMGLRPKPKTQTKFFFGCHCMISFYIENNEVKSALFFLKQLHLPIYSILILYSQGLIHFEQNLGCTNATFLSAFSSEDAGVLTLTNRLFAVNQEGLTSTFNQADVTIDYLRSNIGENPAKGRGECLKRCKLV